MREMEREPLRQLIERSIRENVIDGHAIDQDGSNVLIIGEEIHYCSDEGARTFLASRSERPTAGSQSGNGQNTADDAQDTDDEWTNGGGDADVSGTRRGAQETYRDSERLEARRAEPRSPDINRPSTRSGEMSPEASYSAAPAGGTSSAGFVSRASTGAIT